MSWDIFWVQHTELVHKMSLWKTTHVKSQVKGLWKWVINILVAFSWYQYDWLQGIYRGDPSQGCLNGACQVMIHLPRRLEQIGPCSVFMGRSTSGELEQGLLSKEPHPWIGCISCPPLTRDQGCLLWGGQHAPIHTYAWGRQKNNFLSMIYANGLCVFH